MILKFGMVVDNFVHPDFRGGIKGVQRATYEYACNIFYEENMAADREREEYFKNLGLKVVRYTNLDIIKNIDSVLADLKKIISQ